jgi:hypothetical protein
VSEETRQRSAKAAKGKAANFSSLLDIGSVHVSATATAAEDDGSADEEEVPGKDRARRSAHNKHLSRFSGQ